MTKELLYIAHDIPLIHKLAVLGFHHLLTAFLSDRSFYFSSWFTGVVISFWFFALLAAGAEKHMSRCHSAQRLRTGGIG